MQGKLKNKSDFNQNNEENSLLYTTNFFFVWFTEFERTTELTDWENRRQWKYFFQSASYVVVDAHSNRISVGLCNFIWM